MALFTSEDVEYETHVVKKGDTLTSISKLYDVSIGKIANLNDILSSSDLIVGTTIKIKEKEATYPIVYKTPTTSDDEVELIAYEAGKQVITLDDAHQSEIDKMKEQYQVTGDIRTMYNDVLYSKMTGNYDIRGTYKDLNDISIINSDDTTSIYSVKNTSSTDKPLNRVTKNSAVENASSRKASTQIATINLTKQS